jgi:hypothetical protein
MGPHLRCPDHASTACFSVDFLLLKLLKLRHFQVDELVVAWKLYHVRPGVALVAGAGAAVVAGAADAADAEHSSGGAGELEQANDVASALAAVDEAAVPSHRLSNSTSMPAHYPWTHDIDERHDVLQELRE